VSKFLPPVTPGRSQFTKTGMSNVRCRFVACAFAAIRCGRDDADYRKRVALWQVSSRFALKTAFCGKLNAVLPEKPQSPDVNTIFVG
jgi:hypothetical protein